MKKHTKRIIYSFTFLVVILFGWSPAVVLSSEDKYSLSQSLSHYIMGLMHDWYGEANEAIEEYEKALQFDSTNYILYLRLGANYARAGDLEKAITKLQEASQYNPEDLQSHYVLALIYSTQKDFDKAAVEYEAILTRFSQTNPENAEIHHYLGQLYYSQKRYEEAIREFETILNVEPKNAEVMYILGSLYLDTNDREKAIGWFKKAIEADPQHDGSLNSLSYVYAEDGIYLDDALQLIQRAVELDPVNGAYLDTLGWVYYKKGMYTEALESLKKADEYLEDPIIYDHMGDVYLKMNEAENARNYWEMSLKLSPEQAHILEKLNALLGNDQVSHQTRQ